MNYSVGIRMRMGRLQGGLANELIQICRGNIETHRSEIAQMSQFLLDCVCRHPNLDLACSCVLRERPPIHVNHSVIAPWMMRYSPTSALLPSIIKTLCSLIVRFKSIRSFAGAQVGLSLIVCSLSWVMWVSMGRSRCAINIATASMTWNTSVRRCRSGNSSPSEFQLIRETYSANFASSDHRCSSNSWWSA